MQAGRNAMESTKEAAANVGASARAGMDKTRAVQGQVEKATAHNAEDMDAAEVRRQERVQAAEDEKRHAMGANAAAKEHATTGGGTGAYHPSQGAPGVDKAQGAQPTGGHVQDGVAESRPVGTATGTAARTSDAHNPRVGSDFSQARGTGGQHQ